MAALSGGPSAPSRWSALQLGALAVVTLLAFAWRFDRARSEPPLFDEGTSIRIAERFFDPAADWPRHGGDHPALGIHLLGASAWLFGRDDVGYRMLNVIAGSATVPLLALAVAASASRWEGVAAGLLLAVNPFHVGLSALAIEVAFQILFVTAALAFAAQLPRGGPAALWGCAAALGLGFMCNESTVLVLLAWAGVAALRPERLAGLRARDLTIGVAIGLALVAQDLHYNLTARDADFYYVNYLDHLTRIAQPSFGLQGVGFFLRDAFEAAAVLPAGLWEDHRGEYLGPGVALGVFLFAAWLASFVPGSDPSGGLWSGPLHVFVVVTTFGGAVVESPMLDSATWTWPLPAVGCASALGARLAFRLGAPAVVLAALVTAMLVEWPAGLPPLG